MLVSAVQMDVRAGDLDTNFDRAYRLIREAARRGSRAILLPEMWNIGFAGAGLLDLAKATFRPTVRFMCEAAREAKAWILGSVGEPEGDRVYNTLLWCSPRGEVAGSYRKVHLFTPTGEDRHFAAGENAAPVETDFGLTGGLICFDLRFPELARKLALEGAWILFVPAQFPHPRSAHWDVLLQARAIENQVWVVASNRVGRSGDLEYFGRSAIIDPWGRVVEAEYEEREAVISAEVSLEQVEAVRSELPCPRRPEVYAG